MNKDPVQDVKAVVDEIESQLSALRRSLGSTPSMTSEDATSAHDSLREALKLVATAGDAVACW